MYDRLHTGRTTPQGVVAITYQASHYCLDCAPKIFEGQTLSVEYNDERGWTTITVEDSKKFVQQLINGDIHDINPGGVCLRLQGEYSPHEHCTFGADCERAIPPEHHDKHNLPIGAFLDLNYLQTE